MAVNEIVESWGSTMKPSTGHWVRGSNFFWRKGELKVLK